MAKAAAQKEVQTATRPAESSGSGDLERLLKQPLGTGRDLAQSLAAIRKSVSNELPRVINTIPFRSGLSEDDRKRFVVRIASCAIREIERAVRDGKDQLLKCTARSIVDAIREAASDGLLIDGRAAYLVPYGNVAKYSPSYIGMLQVARNSKVIKDGYAMEVYSNDEFRFEEVGDKQVLYHRPTFDDRGEIIAAFAKVILPDDSVRYEVVSKDDLAAIRRASKAPNSPAYKEFQGQMSRKSALRRLLKLYAADPFFGDFLGRSDAADTADPRDFEELLDKPVFTGGSRTDRLAASVTPAVEEPETVQGDEALLVTACRECGGMTAEEEIDGCAVVVCLQCGVMANKEG